MVFERCKPNQYSILFEGGHIVANDFLGFWGNVFNGLPYLLQSSLNVLWKRGDVLVRCFEPFLRKRHTLFLEVLVTYFGCVGLKL